MERLVMQNLIEWKHATNRHPLILHGARQVGKTWLLQEFGKTQFDNVAYVSLDNNEFVARQFDGDYNTARLIEALEIATQQHIHPTSTLIILDEIQECPRALTSLKYFSEEAPEYTIAAAGSLLGITMHSGTGFPVGKVDILNLYPLSYLEFLMAMQEQILADKLMHSDKDVLDMLASKYIELLKKYYFVGGMPQAVSAFAQNQSLEQARKIQEAILFGYERDFSKHLSSANTEAAISVWRSIPKHLSHENKRFVFGHIKEGARARQYRSAITWLAQAGLVTQVPRVSKPGLPLTPYADDTAFKLFILDIGLLGALAGIEERTVVNGDTLFTEFKGSLAEQYVCQQLVALSMRPYYWSKQNSSGEIDFLIQTAGKLYPIEVKAQENLRAKSLRTFANAYPKACPRRFSLSGFRNETWMRNVPLYAIDQPAYWE